jgi:methylated-DNA-[protein]-cysteine S-methyltransferase
MATDRETGFSKKVFAAVSRIPKGNTATYSQVAKAAGSPKAARAVGNILARNPHPIKVPCHRVIRADGSVGGYLGQANYKEKVRLLESESVEIIDGKVRQSRLI